MNNPPVKATEALEKPPAAKPLRSRWLPDSEPGPRVNASLIQLSGTKIDTFQ